MLVWHCEDCGWVWPAALVGRPPGGAECEDCGGELAEDVGG